MKKTQFIAYYVDHQGVRHILPLDQDFGCRRAVIKALCRIYGLVWVRV